MTRSWRVALGTWSPCLALSFLVACSGIKEATLFTGFAKPAAVQPDQIQGVDALPPGYNDLGSLIVDCSARPLSESVEDVPLSDVDCTTGRLLGALRERAARVGGTILVGTWCDGDKGAYGLVGGHCEAMVGRPSNLPKVNLPPVEQRATMAWRINVDYRPRSPLRLPVPVSEVKELAHLPPSHIVLGQMRAECEAGCTQDAVADGLLAAASRLGAQAVVGVTCLGAADSWSCQADVAAYQVDPRLNSSAR